jgi:hypothetical protein
MTEIYNKYNKLVVAFTLIEDYATALCKAKELKINAHKVVIKTFQKLFTYYCTECKTRSYFENPEPEDCCKKCNGTSHLYFVGLKQTNKLIEKVYAN